MPFELCRADQDEVRRSLPGDELIPSPRKIITHAVTIGAPAETVWPWLVQLGSGRAGWYSYDRIDNGGVPSAKRIIPELQHVAIGDLMPAIPGTKDAFIIREVRPGKALVLVVPIEPAGEDTETERRMSGPLRISWALVVDPVDGGKTRLISRGRISGDWLAPQPSRAGPSRSPILIERVYRLLAAMPWDLMLPIAMAGHYVLESRMLRGIKWRAERQRSNPPSLNGR